MGCVKGGTWLSPFLYSREQSSSTILGEAILRRICRPTRPRRVSPSHSPPPSTRAPSLGESLCAFGMLCPSTVHPREVVSRCVVCPKARYIAQSLRPSVPPSPRKPHARSRPPGRLNVHWARVCLPTARHTASVTMAGRLCTEKTEAWEGGWWVDALGGGFETNRVVVRLVESSGEIGRAEREDGKRRARFDRGSKPWGG
jgi:hypothetical protein